MRTRRHVPRRRGAVAVLVAICLIPIIAVMALALDGGMLLGQRRQAQAVADAAARAAACSLYNRFGTEAGLDPSNKARAVGLAIAAYNGYANDGTTSTVTINVPPSSSSASYSGQAGCAEAIVTYYQPRYFSAIWSTAKVPVKARAVAQCKIIPTASILLTDPGVAGALTLTGSARLTTNSGIRVNSSSMYSASSSPNGGAVNASNGAYWTNSGPAGNGGLSIVGNYNIPSWATSGTFFSQAPTSGASAMADPFASVAAPTSTGLSVIDRNAIPRQGSPAPYPSGGQYTLSPGLYNGGLNLDSGGVKYTMNPGVYYMKAGGFSVANGTTLTGTGVTIYIDATKDGSGNYGSLSYQGGTTVTLSAPTTTAGGGVPGIVYYQDRGNAAKLNNIANGSNVNMSGATYAPAAEMTIAGGASGASYGSQFIVKTLNLSNGVNITINTPSTSGSGVSKPVVAE